ncbi:MAG: S41 family peptidase [Clostridia bacterium]
MKNHRKRDRLLKNVFLSTSVFLLVLVLVLGSLVFLNWDYISFKVFLTDRYLRTEILDDIYKAETGMDPGGNYFKYFDNLSIAAVTKLIRDTGRDNYTYQYNPVQYTDYKTGREEAAARSEVRELTPDTVYMLLTNFTPESLVFFESSVDELKKYGNLILDLRNNGGGDLNAIFRIADYFIDKGSVMVTEYRRHGSADILARDAKTLVFDNIVILQNERTASASEQLIAALDYNVPGVVTSGTRTYGKYVGQTRIGLLRGFYVKATTLEWRLPDGTPLENGGMIPDYPYTGENIVGHVLGVIL